jgi:hypothetical protein
MVRSVHFDLLQISDHALDVVSHSVQFSYGYLLPCTALLQDEMTMCVQHCDGHAAVRSSLPNVVAPVSWVLEIQQMVLL